MNRPFVLPLVLALALLGGATRAVQGQESPNPPVVDASKLQLRFLKVRATQPTELVRVIEGVGTRRFVVRDEAGTLSGPFDNVRTSMDTVVIYDVPERVVAIVDALQAAEEALGSPDAEDASDGEVTTAEYAPRHVRIESLLRALTSYQRKLRDRGASGGWVPNVTLIETPATLVLRDAPDRLQEMLGLLARIDVPPPQLTISCWLLRGTDAPASASAVPAELVANLKQLVPFAGFERVSMAVLRTTVVAGEEQVVSGDFEHDGQRQEYDLKLTPAGYDAVRRVYSLSRCQFEASTGQRFETGAVIGAGEYVVLGGSGQDPLFVVLRILPIEN